MDERPFLVDTQPEMPVKLDDSKMNTALSDSASKPAQLSASRLHHNNDEMTTTASDTRTKNVNVSEALINVSKMTPTSNSTRTTTTAPSLSSSRYPDTKITVESTDQTVQSMAQKVNAVNKTGSENNRTADHIIVTVPSDEFHDDALRDVRTPVTKLPAAVNGDAMDVNGLKEAVNDKSLSLSNQQVKVNCLCHYGVHILDVEVENV